MKLCKAITKVHQKAERHVARQSVELKFRTLERKARENSTFIWKSNLSLLFGWLIWKSSSDPAWSNDLWNFSNVWCVHFKLFLIPQFWIATSLAKICYARWWEKEQTGGDIMVIVAELGYKDG